MSYLLKVAELEVLVSSKDIKNLHITVNPPYGEVRVSKPLKTSLEYVRFAIFKRLGWIRRQRASFAGQARETRREYIDRETHYLFNKAYLLKVEVASSHEKCGVTKKGKYLVMRVSPKSTLKSREKLMREFYRKELSAFLERLIPRCEAKLGVKPSMYKIRIMKTRFGSCSHKNGGQSGVITLNLELAKKPYKCIKYVVMHELVHLRERRHNEGFYALLKSVLPNYMELQRELNDSVLGCYGF